MDKSNLYWLTNKEDYCEKTVIVDKINENKYRVLEFGQFKPILHGGHLIDNSIAAILNKYAADQITAINQVIIWRKSTDETRTDYSEIELKHQLDLETFKTAVYDGYRIYLLMDNQIYISAALMDKLISEYGKANELGFIKEWPLYAG